MSKEDNGGQAFPGMVEVGDSGDYSLVNEPGMTLRDWFAGQALSRLAFYLNPKQAAESSYAYADAMLEARKR